MSTLFFVQLAEEIQEGELKALDAAVALFVMDWRGRLDSAMLVLTRIGGGLPMAIVTTVAAFVLMLRKRRWEAAFLVVTGVGTGLLNWGLKLAFHRTRPESPFMIDLPDSFSFPSGHAMGSTGVLASLVVVAHVVGLRRAERNLITLAGLLLALGIGASRVYFGVHYPSDVLGGQLAAAAWVSAVTGWFYPRLLPGEESGNEPSEPAKDSGART